MTRILSCQDIADEVTASFDFLSTSLRDVPGRHRSLRTIFEHTWTLLPEKEQEPLGRLAVFRSGFTREAAREVAGASLVTLSALLDRSILHESGSDAERNLFGRRYELHEMLRQYSEEKLRLSPEAYHAARTRHSHYYLTWLTSLEPALKGAEQKRTLDAISREVENIKAAWMWAADHEALDVLHQALLSLIIFFVFRDRYAEALRLLAATAQAIGRRPETEETTLIKGLIYAGEGGILSSLNRYTEAEQVLLKALEILDPVGTAVGWRLRSVRLPSPLPEVVRHASNAWSGASPTTDNGETLTDRPTHWRGFPNWSLTAEMTTSAARAISQRP